MAPLWRQLLLDPRLNKRFGVMCLSWFALSVGYYGLSLSVANMGWGVRLANAISGLVELPMYVLAVWLIEKPWAGRRMAALSGLLVCGLSCLLAALQSLREADSDPESKPGGLMLLFVYVGKAGVSMSFAVIYLYAAELFPTDIRGRSMSLQSLVSRIGGMCSPVIASLGHDSLALPMILFGLPSLVSGVLLCGLPETRGTSLPDTIDDVKVPAASCSCCIWRRYKQLDEDKAALQIGRDPPAMTLGAISA